MTTPFIFGYRILFFLLVLMFIGISSFGQGTIRGIVTDENGETAIGAAVYLKDNIGVGTTTDLDGNYSLEIEEAGMVTYVISYLGYAPVEDSIQLKGGEIVIRNYTLQPMAQEIVGVEITAKSVRANDHYMEKIKKRSPTTIDYVSAETMSKTGDANVVSAVARVSGVSTFGGLITVRGIGDRYIKTTVNGAQIPTLDPFTNNIKLDLFPASLVDNIMVTKTASPDLPGDWAGAYLSVLTKDYPDQLSINAKFSVGFNTQSTFKDVLTSPTSSTDWLGFDNGFREFDHASFALANPTPTQYDQFIALGLGDFYSSLGITDSWLPGSSEGEVYTRLGLVELGLLEPAKLDDDDAVADAKAQYRTADYEGQAFTIINNEAAQSGKSLKNNWNTFFERARPNISQSFSLGNQVKLFGRPLGFVFGYRYESKIVFDGDATASVASVDANGDRLVVSSQRRQFSQEINGWSALANLAYKFNKNNSISVMFMPNLRGVNNVQDAADALGSETYQLLLTKNQFYEERRQLVFQVGTEHYFPRSEMKMELDGSYTWGNSSAPDFKFLTYFQDEDDRFVIDVTESDTHRYFRKLKENMGDARAALEFPLLKKSGLPRKLKLGGAYRRKTRDFDQYDYRVVYNSNEILIKDGDFDRFFDLETFGINDEFSFEKFYEESGNPANRTIGHKQITSGFVMTDFTIIPVLRVSGGLRIEYADIFADVYLYDQLGYDEDDERRQFVGEIFTVKPANLEEVSFLPSLNMIYKIKDDEQAQINLRANYSRTVARPSIRELTDIIVFDFELRDFVFGNSGLKSVDINNYDLRLENYFKGRHGISLSLFYKDFKNHIELVNTNQGFTWQNVDESRVLGMEIEGKVEFWRNFEFRANLTLVNSQTEFVRSRLQIDDGVRNFIPLDTVTRTMFGQAPYVVNGILSYTSDSIGLTATLSYNLQGPKLVLTSIVDGIPDIFEQPRHLLDVKVTKTLDKKEYFSVSVKARNLLNAAIRRSYDYDGGEDIDFDKFKTGTTIEVGISFQL